MLTGAFVLGFLLFAQSADDSLQRANRLLQSQDLPAAEQAIDQALAINPRMAPALVLKAKVAAMTDHLDEAQQAIEMALKIDPAPSSYFVLGFILYTKNDFPAAREALASADPKDPRVLFYQALTAEGLNDIPQAVRYYQQTLKLARNMSEPRVAYSRLLFKLGKFDDAEAMADEALKIAPADPAGLLEKSRNRFERADYAAAAGYGEAALKGALGTPMERRIRYLLIRAYQSLGNQDMADKHRAIFERLPMPLVR